MPLLNIFQSLLIILLIFIPLYPKFPLLGVTGTYVAIRLDDIVVSLCLLIYILDQIKRKFPVFKEKITYLFLAYFLAIFLSFLHALLIFQTDSPSILALNLLRRFEYISLFFITLSAIKRPDDLRPTYITVFLTSIFVAIYGYGQKYLNFPVISTMNEEFSKGQLLQMNFWSRISSTFAGHYDLAAYLSIVLIIIGSITIISKKNWIKIPSIIIWLPLFNLLTLTASRVSNFAYIGGFIVVLLLLKKYIWIIPVFILFAISLFNSKDLNQRLVATIPLVQKQLSFLLPATPTPAPSIIPTPTPTKVVAIQPTISIKPKITPTLPTPTIYRHPKEEFPDIDADAGVARSGEIRFNVEWPRAITAFKKFPLLGTGLGSITLATDNDYLRLLGESGVLGFVTFMIIFIFFMLKTITIFFSSKKSPYKQYIFGLFGCLLTMLANATLIDVFEASKTAYLFWIMLAVYYRLIQFYQQND